MSAQTYPEDRRPKRKPRVFFFMRALGRRELPAVLRIEGQSFERERTLKHDFFAATGLFADSSGRRVVLKMGRNADLFSIPMSWIGRLLCKRELHFYRQLCDLPSVPKVLGTVGKTGFVMEFVQGVPLSDAQAVPETFFDDLFGLIAKVHERGLAYVDTNKPQNILLGDDGKPHLIDFQISWDGRFLRKLRLGRALLRRLQADDIYHLTKHKRRLFPTQLSINESAALEQKSTFIRAHRSLTRPYFLIRRRLFKRLRAAGRLLPEGSK